MAKIPIIHECDFALPPGAMTPEESVCRVCGKSIMDQKIEMPEPQEEKKAKFVKYRSIHTLDDFLIEKIREQGLDGGEFVILNKYHGGNLSVWADTEQVFWSTKEKVFTRKENYFNFFSSDARRKYTEKIAKEIHLHYGKPVALFFELFGGAYPHPDVKNFSNEKHPRINKEVSYCPHLDIRLIDIKVEGKYIDYDEMVKVAALHNIKPAQELFRGNFDDCIKFNPVFLDETYKSYKLPPIDNNYSEGVVIKPVEYKEFKNRSRLIIKHKNPKFREKRRTSRKNSKSPELSEESKKKVDELSKCITENRLNNVLSHGVKFDNDKAMPKVIGLMVKDIIEEENSNDLTKQEKKALQSIVADFVRPIILPEIKKNQFEKGE